MNTPTQSGQQAGTPAPRDWWPVVYYATVTFILLLAAYERFHLPLAPLGDPDSWGYLGPAVLKLTGAGFRHTNGVAFLYPGFLLFILGLANSFSAVTIVQHLLGLATGGLMMGCWSKTKRFTRYISPRMHEAFGLALGAIYLLSRHPIEYEHQLRPESITPFFAILNIFLTLHFFDTRRREGSSLYGATVATLVLVNLVVLVTLKTSFALSILFSVIPVLIALSDRRETWPRRTLVIFVALITAVAAARTEQVLAESDPVAKSFLPTSLFTIHARLIAQQMDEDITRGECAPHGCDWLRQVDASLHEEIEKSRQSGRYWRSLRFGPDYLMHEDSLRRWRNRFFYGDIDKQLEFYRFYYLRTLRMHPERMAAKVVQEMAQFYLGYKQAFLATPRVTFARPAAYTLGNLERHLISKPLYPPSSRYLEELKRLSFSKATIDQPVLVTLVGGLLSILYPPVFFAALGAIWFFRSKLCQAYRSLAVVVLFVYSYNFGNCLGTAIVHSLSVSRYIVAQYSFALLSECVGLLFLAEIGMQKRRITPEPVERP